MDWHIVTSSKGGVGKTILSLMLWQAYTVRKNKRVLLVELNGMNPDLYRLTALTKENPDNPLERATEIKLANHDFRIYEIACSGRAYHVMWPVFPHHMLHGHQEFLLFIDNLYSEINKIDSLYCFDAIIIDTNFHFANIFPSTIEDYQKYSVFKKGDSQQNFFVWFLWVFKQLQALWRLTNAFEKIKDSHIPNQFGLNADNLISVASTLDNTRQCLPCRLSSSLIHVFNTPSLVGPCPDPKMIGSTLLKKMGNMLGSSSKKDSQADYLVVNALNALGEKKAKGTTCKNFNALITSFETIALKIKNGDIPKKSINQVSDIFSIILGNYANEPGCRCENNIIPIPEYIENMKSYTDWLILADDMFTLFSADGNEAKNMLDNFVKNLDISGILK